MTDTSLNIEINNLPFNLRQEVADFVAFLKLKKVDKTVLVKREFGYAKGKIELSDDFDAPLDEFNEYF